MHVATSHDVSSRDVRIVCPRLNASPFPCKCESEPKPSNDGTVPWWFWYLATEWSPATHQLVGTQFEKPCIRLCGLWPGDVRGFQNIILCSMCIVKLNCAISKAFCYWTGDTGDFPRVFIPLLYNWKAVWWGVTMALHLHPHPPAEYDNETFISFVSISNYIPFWHKVTPPHSTTKRFSKCLPFICLLFQRARLLKRNEV